MMKAWNCRIPLKIKLFLWMAFHDKIQSAVQLRKRKWAGPEECKLCGERETTDHILFMCPVANFMWILIRDICGLVSAPTTCAELAEILVHRRASRFGALFLFLCAGALWAIWKNEERLGFRRQTHEESAGARPQDEGVSPKLEAVVASGRQGKAGRLTPGPNGYVISLVLS